MVVARDSRQLVLEEEEPYDEVARCCFHLDVAVCRFAPRVP